MLASILIDSKHEDELQNRGYFLLLYCSSTPFRTKNRTSRDPRSKFLAERLLSYSSLAGKGNWFASKANEQASKQVAVSNLEINSRFLELTTAPSLDQKQLINHYAILIVSGTAIKLSDSSILKLCRSRYILDK